MTSGTVVRLEPVVSWPRVMRPGRPYLIEVDLRLADGDDWPYEEEEFAFTCLLDGSAPVTVEAVHDASVVLHRFGGSYGPAEFVVIPHGEPGRRSLWLTIVTERGVAVRTVELPVDIRQTVDDNDLATVPRAVRATVASRSSVPSPEQADPEVPAAPGTSPPDIEPEPPHRLCLVADIERFGAGRDAGRFAARQALVQVIRSACRAAGIDWRQCVPEDRGDGLLLILPAGLDAEVVIDELTTALETALAEFNRRFSAARRLRLLVVLAEGEIHSYPRGYAGTALIAAWELLDSARMRGVLRNNPDDDLAVMMTRVHEAPGFRQAIADLFHSLYTPRAALGVLETIGFPPERMPAMTSSQAFWRAAVRDLVNGIIPDGLERLLEVARRQFPGNQQLIELHGGLSSRDRRPDVVQEQDLASADRYPTLTLVGADHPDAPERFLRLVRDQVDRNAELLFVTGYQNQTAVRIAHPGDLSAVLDRLRRATESWGRDSELIFESYPFRPYCLRGIRAVGPDGRSEQVREVPATVRVGELAKALRPDRDGVRIVMPDGRERLRRLSGAHTLHDAGLRDDDEVWVLTEELRVAEWAAVFFDGLLGLPDVHLVVDGTKLIEIGYGELSEAEGRAAVLDGLAGLVARKRAEVTCVFDAAGLTGLEGLVMPRGVRVLFTAPSEPAHELIGRLIQAESPNRDVVVVAARREPADPARETLWWVAPLVLLHGVDPTAYEAAVRDRADDAGADQSEITAEPDPRAVATAAEFVALLREYRVWKGAPTYREMSRNVGQRFSASTFATIDQRRGLLRLELVMAYLTGCGADETELETWREAWRRTALRDAGSTAAEPDPRTAVTAAEFVALLREYRVWKGAPTYREMSRNVGQRFSANTFATIDQRRGLLRLELVMAYLTACGADEAELETWREEWRRIALQESDGDTAE